MRWFIIIYLVVIQRTLYLDLYKLLYRHSSDPPRSLKIKIINGSYTALHQVF